LIDFPNCFTDRLSKKFSINQSYVVDRILDVENASVKHINDKPTAWCVHTEDNVIVADELVLSQHKPATYSL